MSWFIIGGLLLIGLTLLGVEVFVVPGTTFVGIVGVLCMLGGVYLAYEHYGETAGHFTLAGSVIAIGVSAVLGYKAFMSRKFSVNEVIDGKTNVLEDNTIQVGDEGITISNLRPSGKAEFGETKLEVTTMGAFVGSQTAITVIRISGNKIFVQPKNLNN